METWIFIGRILFVLILLGSGIGHLTTLDATGAHAESRGVKPGKPMAAISGLAFLAAGIGILLGIWMDLAFLGVAALVLIIAVTMHRFWEMDGDEQQMEMSHFMKNLNIAGSCLIAFGFIAGLGYNDLTITDPLFSL